MLIILIWSIYSGITYYAGAATTRAPCATCGGRPAWARRMTDEEQALVQPFLFDPAKPKKQAQLINDGLSAARRVRHGTRPLWAQHMHDTLGDVDVVLPYDARSAAIWSRTTMPKWCSPRNSPSWWP